MIPSIMNEVSNTILQNLEQNLGNYSKCAQIRIHT